jgi:hypothetical protein
VFISLAIVTNYHELDGLKQGKCILSLLWRPEVRNESVSSAVLPVETGAQWTFSLPLPTSGGWWWCPFAPLACDHTLQSLHFISPSLFMSSLPSAFFGSTGV